MSGFSCNYNNAITNVAYNDMYLDNSGNLATSNGENEIVENCSHALSLWLGEYVFNTNVGLDYNTWIQSDNPNMSIVRASIRKALLLVGGVLSVGNIVFQLQRNTRVLTIAVVVNLTNGNNITITVGG